jgi:glycosyltransferase involved in cell wall biosynthesis
VRLGHQYAERHGVPDLLHAHSARWAGAAAARLGDHLGVPCVLSEHYSGFRRDAIPSWRRSLVREGFDGADAVATVSTPLRTTLAEQGFVPADDVAVLPNVVDASFFSRPPRSRPSPPPFRFVTVAQLHPKKNVGGLLSAFSTAFSAADGVALTVVGDSPRRSELERKARRLGLRDRVSFRGALDRAGVRDALWNAHAFVLPSHHETFGVVLIEALATGLPVVATRCGGPEDIVTPETGFLVPPGAPDALAHALRRMRAEWTLFAPSTLRASALRRYGSEPFVERTINFYRRVLR